jgi:hypothetical protein
MFAGMLTKKPFYEDNCVDFQSTFCRRFMGEEGQMRILFPTTFSVFNLFVFVALMFVSITEWNQIKLRLFDRLNSRHMAKKSLSKSKSENKFLVKTFLSFKATTFFARF